MAEVTRVPFALPTGQLSVVDEICKERGLTRSCLFRLGIGLVVEAHKASKDGSYTGITRDHRKLDTLIVIPI